MTSRSEQWRLSLTRQVGAAAVTMFGTAGTFFAIVRRDSISSTHLQNLSSSSFISLSIDTARRTHTHSGKFAHCSIRLDGTKSTGRWSLATSTVVAAVGFTITVTARHVDFSSWLHPHLHRALCVLAGLPAGFPHSCELNST